MTSSKYGEQLFKSLMEQRGHNVEDLTAEKAYQIKDIDFRITSPSGKVATFEVKYDSRIHSTGNLFVEFFSAHNYEGLGWYEFCEADYIAYGDAQAEVFYCFLLDDLRQIVSTHKLNVATTDKEKVAGYLVPLRLIENMEVVK